MLAIPGMNPGIFILGGDGNGGGSGPGGGKGKGKGKGANGKGKGNNANGGGKGAGNCGPGSGGGCPNPKHGGKGKTHAGDPVDIVTGRVYTLPQVDMVLTGPLVFTIERSYSSFARARDVGLGFGWSHSLAWSIEVRRRSIEVQAPFLEPAVYDLPVSGAVAHLRDIGNLRMDAETPVLVDFENGHIHLFEKDPLNEQRYRLAAITDRAGNQIALSYDAAGLAGLVDSAGRRVEVKRTPTGHMERFELATKTSRKVWYRRYTFSDEGNLVSAVDAEGHPTTYHYDFEHRLTEQVTPTGQHAHFAYDSKGRCVETWVDRGNLPDPALAPDVPMTLADGQTPAKGMLHIKLDYEADCTLLYDSRQTKRFDHNDHGTLDLSSGIWVDSLKYNAHGDMIEYGDGENHAEHYQRDEHGRLIGVLDATKSMTRFAYDPNGNLAEVEDATGKSLTYQHDKAGNLTETADALGTLLRCAYDRRGLRTVSEMPNGAVTRWEHDAEGNVIRLTEPHGKARRLDVDDLGRITAFSDEEGYRTHYRYNAMNALVSVTLPNGATHGATYNADGQMTSYTSPDKGVWKLFWAGYSSVFQVEKPSGETLRFGYNREGHLTHVLNEKGEVHKIERDVAGRVVGDTFFDGRQYRYRLDGNGRLAKHHNGAGEVTEIERDACGRILKRTYDDDTADEFEYDAEGRLVRADNGKVACTWHYDSRGNLTKETQTHQGRTVTTEHTYNPANQRTTTRNNFGYAAAYERDLMGWQHKVHLGTGQTIERTWDGLGREVLRSLPKGGHVICRYDGLALVERHIVSPTRHTNTPPWAGPLPEGTTFAEGFVCSPGGEVVEHSASDGTRDRFGYDPAGRVVGRVNSRGELKEAYIYEGTGRIEETLGARRHYGTGGVLLERGATRYRYDDEQRRTHKADGDSLTRYEWNGRGMLSAVVLPNGTRVENTYDTQGRRVVKRMRRPDSQVVETRFVWAGDDMIQETTTEPTATGKNLLRERAFVYDDEGFLLSQRETVWKNGEKETGTWVHAVRGPGEMPTLLVSGEGEIVAKMRGTVWGLVAAEPGAKTSTPIRYPGQYADEETGLCYNRYRFYDPEVGLYISPDPVGLQGGLGAFEYARSNPLRMIDTEGMDVRATITGTAGTHSSTSGQKYNPDKSPVKLHEIVVAALPTEGPAGGSKWPSVRDGDPGKCAEPQALSKYLFEWEKKNKTKLDPNNKAQVAAALNSMDKINAYDKKEKATRSPCPNCSQMFANLMATYGAPSPSKIDEGYIPGGGRGNFEPPNPNYKGPAHSKYPI